MAFGAYFNADIGFSRTDFYLIATRTPNAGIGVIRMNAVFHCIFNPLKLNSLNSRPAVASKKRKFFKTAEFAPKNE